MGSEKGLYPCVRSDEPLRAPEPGCHCPAASAAWITEQEITCKRDAPCRGRSPMPSQAHALGDRKRREFTREGEGTNSTFTQNILFLSWKET